MTNTTATTVVNAALTYAREGIPVFPCSEKKPLTPNGFYDATTNEEQIRNWWRINPDAQIGMPTGSKSHILSIDLDTPEAGKFLEELETQHGLLPGTRHIETSPGRRQIHMLVPDGVSTKTTAGFRGVPGFDVRGDGGYTILPPSIHHKTGKQYQILIDSPLAEAPHWLLVMVAKQKSTNDRDRSAGEPIPEGQRNTTLTSLAGSMRRVGFSEAAILEALLEENQRCLPPLSEHEIDQIAHSVARYDPTAKTVPRRNSRGDVVEPPVATLNDLCRQAFNDFGNAQRFITMYGENVRYCTPMKKWLIWDGGRWKIDEKDKIRELVQEVMLAFVHQAVTAGDDAMMRFAGRSLNSQRLSSALRETQPLLAVHPDDLDKNPCLLNCLNGTVELTSGKLREHRRDDLITKIVPHEYDPHAPCPKFLAFVEGTLGPLVPYVQRALGYSITGLTSEKKAFLCLGPTDTGKTTLLNLFRSLFDEYATLILIDALMQRDEDNNSRADLADLRGVRFAMTSETEEGQRLREGKLKRITQGQGRIKAVRKYENPIEFTETHKLWIDANHRPVVRGTDNAIWNRLSPIPFDRPLAESEIDRSLPAKLHEEAQGILAWVIQGSLLWFREGLGKPPEIESTRTTWRLEMDRLGAFRESCCTRGPGFSVQARPLYKEYRRWAEEAGERPMTETMFGLRMKEAGIEKALDARKLVMYIGIALKSSVNG